MNNNRMTTHWDVFCRVIDNHGDVGVCWRLAADLARRGVRVRLWLDDASALSWMAPTGAAGVEIREWPTVDDGTEPGDVVIEAFGCELPAFFVERMRASSRMPLWINLEYLSAEAYVERAHKLQSPQPNGLRKWFFYPGFTHRTGGLVRERDLMARREAFDALRWLTEHASAPNRDERVVSLFCYEQPSLSNWLDRLAERPTLLLAADGHAARQVAAALGPSLRRAQLRAVLIPRLTQRDYDHLLWASDLNFVRGEDSFVRAQWAGKPFIWHIYPQDDGAHFEKMEAFLDRYLAGVDASAKTEIGAAWRAWNASPTALPEGSPAAIGPSAAWRRLAIDWRAKLLGLPDLATQLLDFATETR